MQYTNFSIELSLSCKGQNKSKLQKQLSNILLLGPSKDSLKSNLNFKVSVFISIANGRIEFYIAYLIMEYWLQ